MDNFDVVIGIEVHCELKTKSKMFSSAPNDFGKDTNTLVNEVDLGCPGILPVLNKEGVILAIKAASSLNCEIAKVLTFDRKNYFYSDLPKGFQITQDVSPIGSGGYVDLESGKRIRINRVHMEEDTAKQQHFDGYTLINYNRSGVPLIEVVSEPDMDSVEDAVNFIEKLRSILLYTGVSDVKMEEGSMRCDINISLKPKGSEVFGTKVEIKNLNSVSNVDKAIEYEIKRQADMLNAGENVEQETRRFDEATKTTVLMRKKTSAVDYKYFTEANILPISLEDSFIDEVIKQIPKLADERKKIYIDSYGLTDRDATLLIQVKEISDYYDQLVKHTKEYKLAMNWLMQDVMAYLNKQEITIDKFKLMPENLAKLIETIKAGTIANKQAKVVFEKMVENNQDPLILIKELGMEQVSDDNAIRAMILEVMAANAQSIDDYKNGKDKAVGFLVGQVMKASQGKANPGVVNKLLIEELKKC